MRGRFSTVTVVLLVLVGACGGDSTTPTAPPTTAAPVAAPTTTVAPPTTAAPPVAITTPAPAPEVTLMNGEVVKLFEDFDHGNFDDSTTIDNPWLPMQPGNRLVFEGFTSEEGVQIPHRLVFTVTDLVKVIDGIPSVVIWDIDYSDGELVETELAFFAQDNDGNVWRMGEYPEEWEEGEFVAAPTWIAGLADARAGIAMKARPELGAASYSQGWGPAVGFNDRALVDEMGIVTCVRTGCYQEVLVMDEFNNDEPNAHQLKFYAEGIGNVRVGWRGDDSSTEELELVEIVRLTPEELAELWESALVLEERAYILSEDLYGLTERSQAPGAA